MKPMIQTFDCSTQTLDLREMTDEEYAQYLIDEEVRQADREARQAEQALENASE